MDSPRTPFPRNAPVHLDDSAEGVWALTPNGDWAPWAINTTSVRATTRDMLSTHDFRPAPRCRIKRPASFPQSVISLANAIAAACLVCLTVKWTCTIVLLAVRTIGHNRRRTRVPAVFLHPVVIANCEGRKSVKSHETSQQAGILLIAGERTLSTGGTSYPRVVNELSTEWINIPGRHGS